MSNKLTPKQIEVFGDMKLDFEGILASVIFMLERGQFETAREVNNYIKGEWLIRNDYYGDRYGAYVTTVYPYGGIEEHQWICVSVNTEVAHGRLTTIEGDTKYLLDGDLVSIDFFGKIWLAEEEHYMHYDCAATTIFNQNNDTIWSGSRIHLVLVGRRALEIAKAHATTEYTVGEMAKAVEDYVVGQGYFICRELAGHHIGSELHMRPSIPFSPLMVRKGGDTRFEVGTAVAVEPIIFSQATSAVIGQDNMTLLPLNGEALSVHFETSVLIKEGGK